MTTKFPAELDQFENPRPDTSQATARTHSQQHGDANDAIEAVQRKVGITGSTDPESLDFRVSLLSGVAESLGSAAFQDSTSFGTAQQGQKADTAVQPQALNTAISGVNSQIASQAQEIADIRASQGSGLPGYAAKADIPTSGLGPGDAGRMFSVTNDSDAANNGAWRWDGTTLVKAADRVSALEPVVSIAARTTVGKNLLNPAASLVGYYLDQFSSVPVASAQYSVSDYIPVAGGASYSATTSAGGLRFVTFFNASKQVVTGGSSSAQNTLRNFTTTAETRFVRVSYLTANVSSLQVEAGQATSFEQFHRKASGPDGAPVHSVPLNGSVTMDKVADKAVSLPQTSFSKATRNLYNAADPDVMDGYYIQNVSGAAAPNALYSASGWIPVKSGVTYTRSYSHQGALFDANRAFLSGLANTGTSPSQFTPDVDGFVRLTVLLAGKGSFQLEEGTVATDYEPTVSCSIRLSYPGRSPASVAPKSATESFCLRRLTA